MSTNRIIWRAATVMFALAIATVALLFWQNRVRLINVTFVDGTSDDPSYHLVTIVDLGGDRGMRLWRRWAPLGVAPLSEITNSFDLPMAAGYDGIDIYVRPVRGAAKYGLIFVPWKADSTGTEVEKARVLWLSPDDFATAAQTGHLDVQGIESLEPFDTRIVSKQ